MENGDRRFLHREHPLLRTCMGVIPIIRSGALSVKAFRTPVVESGSAR